MTNGNGRNAGQGAGRGTAKRGELRAAFLNGNGDFIKAWLHIALERYFLEKAGRWAFEPFELLIDHEAQLALDLKNIYSQCDAIRQAHLRSAVSDLIAEIPASPEYAETFECLLELARLMPAYEVLRVLPARVGNDQFGAMRDGHGNNYFDRVILAVVDLAVTTSDALRCLQALISSRYFEVSYSAVAFTALCRVDPDHWPLHLGSLREGINRLLHKYDLDANAKRRHGRRFIDAVGLARLRDDLDQLHMDFAESRFALSDSWLWDALFQGSDSLLNWRFTANQNVIELYDRSRPDVAVEVPFEKMNAILKSARQSARPAPLRREHEIVTGGNTFVQVAVRLREKLGLDVYAHDTPG